MIKITIQGHYDAHIYINALTGAFDDPAHYHCEYYRPGLPVVAFNFKSNGNMSEVIATATALISQHLQKGGEKK